MEMNAFLKNAAKDKKMLPVVSFPAAKKLGIPVDALVRDASLQAKAMLLMAEETKTPAVVSLMDLSVEAEAFGAKVRYAPGEVPVVTGRLISDEEEADELAVPELSAGRIPVFIDAIRQAKEMIHDKPVIAGMIGPFSLAGRLMDVTEIMYTCYDEPETVQTVLRKTTDFLLAYGAALKEAGADGLILAEPLIGIMSPEMMAEFSLPYVKEIVKKLQSETFAVIYHNCGNAVPFMLDQIISQGAAAYHFGNAVDMDDILKRIPDNVICMGNLDPAGIVAKSDEGGVKEAVCDMLLKYGGHPNFIPSTGCDVPYDTPWENILALFG